VTITVPQLGDINVDGKVDVKDLKLLTAAMNTLANGPNDLRDLNGDGRIDGKDVALLVKRCTGPGCGSKDGDKDDGDGHDRDRDDRDKDDRERGDREGRDRN